MTEEAHPSVNKPDDALFRDAFSRRDLAEALLKPIMPELVSGLLDWSSLKTEAIPGISAGLQENRNDLVYRVRFSGQQTDLCLFVALEHQSRPDEWIAYRLNEYINLVWRKVMAQTPKPKGLPVVVPVVVYIGKPPWTAPRSLRELMAAPPGVVEVLGEVLPSTGYILVDLSPSSAHKLPEDPLAAAVLGVMRAAKAGRLDEELPGIAQSLAGHPRTEALRHLLQELFSYYLCRTELSPEQIRGIVLPRIPEHQKEVIMSYAEQILRQGVSQGLSQGLSQGRIQTLRDNVLEVLEMRFGGVPEGLREEIETIAEEAKLRNLHREAILVASLEVFAEKI